jgi:DNA-binding transcriptional MerR regulator
MDFYTTAHVAQLFTVTHQTVKNWSKEFAAYLSPTATPQEGKKRMFTLDDVRVFALVHDYGKRGFGYDDAHLALRSGQRGELPNTTEVVPTMPPALLTTLREEISSLRLQLRSTETGRDEAQGQVKLLKEQLSDKERQIRELIEENAHLKAQRRQE